jgi:SSS family transporter
MPGELIRNGLGYFVWIPTIILLTPVINRIIIPALMRLRTTTVYDYFETRYGLSARLLGAAVFSVTRLLWTGLVIHTISFALAEMTGFPIWQIVIVIGLITTAFTTAGGAAAVVWTDCFQFLIQIAGALYVPLYIMSLTKVGPAEWWSTFEAAGRTSVPVFSLDLTVRITIVGAVLESVLWNLCTHSSDQMATQRYFSTPSVKAAQRSVWVFTVTQILLTILLMLCGLALFYLHFSRSGLPLQEFQNQIATGDTADRLLPRFIVQELPVGLAGLLIAAMMAAAIDSLSSGINSIASVGLIDIFQRLRIVSSDKNDLAKDVAQARVIAIVVGLAGTLIALGVTSARADDWNLIDLIHRFNHLFVAPLGVIMLLAILRPCVGLKAAIVGFFAGCVGSLAVAFSGPLLRPFGFERAISYTWIMPVSFVVSWAVSEIVAAFAPARQNDVIVASTNGQAPVMANEGAST